MGNLKVVINHSANSRLKINTETAKKFKIEYLRESIFRFGYATAEVKLEIDDNINNEEILISQDLIEKMKIPTNCKYNFVVEENELIIGPFIGVFLGESFDNLFSNLNLRLLNNYTKYYDKIRGVIFGFCLEGIDKEKLEMTGLLYNPNDKIWEFKTLPYPAAILKRRNLNQDWREYFAIFYKNKLYNYKPLNKWDVYERLNQFDNISELLPPTYLYNSNTDIAKALDKYEDIYVKPIHGNRGLGIYNIKKSGNNYQVKTRERKGNIDWEFSNFKELNSFLEEKLTIGDYIIQKALDLQIDNRSVDFRVGLDKNQNGEWKNNIYVTRVSGDNSIVSNVASSNGYVSYPYDALKQLYKMEDELAKEYEQKLVEIALNIAKSLELTGLQFGKLALDICIDKNNKIWLIEINNINPNDSLMKKLGDNDMFYKIRLTNMLYAKKLSGFSSDKDYISIYFSETLDKKEPNDLVRFNFYVSMPSKSKKVQFCNFVEQISKQYDVVGTLKKPTKKKSVQIEIQGKYDEVKAFIKNITFNRQFASDIKGIAVKSIKNLGSESEMLYK